MIRMLRDWGLAIVVGVAVFFIANRLSTTSPHPDGGEAPAFELVNLNGGKVALADLRGKPVVLNFWATWCGPCKRELPEFSDYARKHPEVTVLGVVVPNNEGDRLPEIVKRFGIAYPVLVADDATQRAYQISSFPTTYVLKPDGTIGGMRVGGMNEDMLARMVEDYGS